MRKIDAIEKVMLDNGGTASWSVIYDNITKYYPNAKSPSDWKEGLRGVVYREMKNNNRFKKIGLGAVAGALSFGVGLISGFTGFRIPFEGGGVGAKYRVLRFGIETVLSIPRYLLKLVG